MANRLGRWSVYTITYIFFLAIVCVVVSLGFYVGAWLGLDRWVTASILVFIGLDLHNRQRRGELDKKFQELEAAVVAEIRRGIVAT